MESSLVTIGISNENHRISGIFGGLYFKRTYLGAQVKLVGQTVVGTQYFEPVLHAEQVLGAIGDLQISFLDPYLLFCIISHIPYSVLLVYISISIYTFSKNFKNFVFYISIYIFLRFSGK